jgi:hypothetical protein
MTKFHFPNTNGENYHIPGNITGDSFTFGNGTVDFVESDNGDISDNSIVFGSGAGDFVFANNITDNTIAFGIGAGDVVSGNGNISNNTIDFGGGAGDTLSSGSDNLSGNAVHFGDGKADTVFMQEPFQTGAISNNTFTFGDGNGDNFFVSPLSESGVTLSNNTIVFGNGDSDTMTFLGGSSHNIITFGNGSNDSIELGSVISPSGGDYIATGTGAGDRVTVGSHTNPDTFAFSLGTGVVTGTSANYTTVVGAQGSAQGGDQLVLNSSGNGNGLGNTLVTETALLPAGTTMASFIASLTLAKGHTYVATNYKHTKGNKSAL